MDSMSDGVSCQLLSASPAAKEESICKGLSWQRHLSTSDEISAAARQVAVRTQLDEIRAASKGRASERATDKTGSSLTDCEELD